MSSFRYNELLRKTLKTVLCFFLISKSMITTFQMRQHLLDPYWKVIESVIDDFEILPIIAWYCFRLPQQCNMKSTWVVNFVINMVVNMVTTWSSTIPDICQFWYTTALFRSVKSTQRSAQICDKIAQTGQNRPKIRILYA